jgi:cell division protein FtsW
MQEQGIDIKNFSLGSITGRTHGDKVIWAIIVLLTLMSLLAIYSSTGTLAYKMTKSPESYLFKQIGLVAAGVFIIYIAHLVNYTFYSKVALLLYAISIPMLIYTLFFGTNINDANRWVKLPIINLTFQTSDLAKLALFMFLSRQLSKRQEVIKDFKKGFIPLITPVFVICILIAPANLSTALLTGATSLILLFIGRVSIKHLALVVLVVAIPLSILVGIANMYYDKNTGKSKPIPEMLTLGRTETWIERVQNFLYAKKESSSYQVQQSKIAIAKGNWAGLGPGNSQARNFLPHPYSDYIYSIILEEYGLLGGVAVLMIYLLFLLRCIRIMKKCPYAFGAFLSLGLSFTLVIQAMANMAVNVNLFPVTGVTLPLISMGGSSFLFTCMAIGIILSVAKNVESVEGAKAVQAGKVVDNNSVGKEEVTGDE